MLRIACLSTLIVLLSFPLYLKAQIFPNEGCHLNFRIIGFSFPKHPGNYNIQIANGYYNNQDSFKKNIFKTIPSQGNVTIAEVPNFGSQYTWRIASVDIHAKADELHHFSTIICPEADTNNIRLKILQQAAKYKDAFVFLDGNKALYNMQGCPVWVMPEKLKETVNEIRDLKISPQGTITFIAGKDIFEINYHGDILWQGPNNGTVSGDKTEQYHHEFTRLSNGHYMVLGDEIMTMATLNDNSSFVNLGDKPSFDSVNHVNLPMVPFGTIIEYDEQGNVVWSWKSSKYYKQSDLVFSKENISLHENAFFFDEKEKMIYVSFRHISRVIKLKYPEGTVVNTYGEIFKPGVPGKGSGLFCGQHACKYSQIGCLFLFNNNGCNMGQAPKIKIFKEPLDGTGNLEKIWEYECAVEGNYPKDAPTGGNVIELPDQSLFTSMGGEYSKVFIVNKEKKVLWSAIAEKWNPDEKKWITLVQYRASIISNRKDFERIILNSELKK